MLFMLIFFPTKRESPQKNCIFYIISSCFSPISCVFSPFSEPWFRSYALTWQSHIQFHIIPARYTDILPSGQIFKHKKAAGR